MSRSVPRHLRVTHGRTRGSHATATTGAGRSAAPRRRSMLVFGVFSLVVAMAAVGLPLTRAEALRQGEAVWSVKCNHSHSAPDDPIVFPAQPGQSHLHDFFGNVSVNANSTTDSLAKAASTCLRGMDQVDRAAYWTPALLHRGRPVTGSPDELRIDAYYAVLNKPIPVQPIPFGLRMIAGDSRAQRPQSTSIAKYNCVGFPSGGEKTPASTAIPSCPSDMYLSASIKFPGCWDGRNLDSPDHKSHMAYPTQGDCPVTHPVRLPTLNIRLRWKMARGIPGSELALSSGGHYSLHADFWNVWSPAVMQWLVTNCLNRMRNCTDIARSDIPVPAGSFSA